MKVVDISNWKCSSLYFWLCRVKVGRGSLVGIATRYGLDGSGIETQGGGKILLTHPDWPWVFPSRLYNGYRVTFNGLKRLGSKVKHPPISKADVKERVERYLYSNSWLLWPVTGWNFRVNLFTFQMYIFHFTFLDSRIKIVEVSEGKFSSLHL
jgi:hypothetical protein